MDVKSINNLRVYVVDFIFYWKIYKPFSKLYEGRSENNVSYLFPWKLQ